MSAADRYFVDSNLLLYYVDPIDSRKQSAPRNGWKFCGWQEPGA
jgi:hypothetical protein